VALVPCIMGNDVACCCYRTSDEDLEPADQVLLRLAASMNGGGGPGACSKAGEGSGIGAATLCQTAAIARPNRRRLSKGVPSERDILLVEQQHPSAPQYGTPAADGATCVAVADTENSGELVAAAQSTEPEETSPSWAHLDRVLIELNAAVAALMGPEAQANQHNVVEEDSSSDSSVASSSYLISGNKANSVDTDDAYELGESLYTTTEDTQGTLLDFSGAEETFSPSDRLLPEVNAVVVTAAAWAAERGLSLEDERFEEMYKHF